MEKDDSLDGGEEMQRSGPSRTPVKKVTTKLTDVDELFEASVNPQHERTPSLQYAEMVYITPSCDQSSSDSTSSTSLEGLNLLNFMPCVPVYGNSPDHYVTVGCRGDHWSSSSDSDVMVQLLKKGICSELKEFQESSYGVPHLSPPTALKTIRNEETGANPEDGILPDHTYEGLEENPLAPPPLGPKPITKETGAIPKVRKSSPSSPPPLGPKPVMKIDPMEELVTAGELLCMCNDCIADYEAYFACSRWVRQAEFWYEDYNLAEYMEDSPCCYCDGCTSGWECLVELSYKWATSLRQDTNRGAWLPQENIDDDIDHFGAQKTTIAMVHNHDEIMPASAEEQGDQQTADNVGASASGNVFQGELVKRDKKQPSFDDEGSFVDYLEPTDLPKQELDTETDLKGEEDKDKKIKIKAYEGLYF